MGRRLFAREMLLSLALGALLSVTTASGQPLVFASDRNGGRFQIWTGEGHDLVNTLQQVTSIGGAAQQSQAPSWSFAAGQIAFQFGASPVRGIHAITPLVDPLSGPAPRLTPTTSVSYPCTDSSDPNWSPDGTQIAFTCTYSGKQEIWTYIIATGLPSKVAFEIGKLYLRPRWSPDGRQIAFVSAGPGTTAEIMLMPANGGTPIQLTTGGYTNFDPTWSPDGHIAFSSNRPAIGTGRHIFRMSATCPEATTNCPAATQLTTANANDTKPTWSPDGLTIAFVSDRTGRQQIFTMDPSLAETLQPPTQASDGTANDVDPAWLITPSLMMVDPVPDLLVASAITTVPVELATKGRPVKGVSADGVTRVVVRIPAVSPGQSFQISVRDESGNAASVPDCGGVASVRSLAFQDTANVTAESVAGVYLAFAVYRAPLDFHRMNTPSDDNVPSRTVTLVITTTAGAPLFSLPVTIVRPPVVLIHGTFADPSSFDNFTPLSPNAPNSTFRVSTLDYSGDIDSHVTKTVPGVPVIGRHIKKNVIGVRYNAPLLLKQLDDHIQAFKEIPSSPVTVPVAAVQADVITHSLGGLMALGMTHVGTEYPGQTPYFGPRTFGLGYIHKLITLGAPHLGTNQALHNLDGTNDCVGGVVALSGAYGLWTATIDGKDYEGAVADLRGDPSNVSPSPANSIPSDNVTLALLNTQGNLTIKAALIAATFTASNNSALLPTLGAVMQAICPRDFLAASYSFQGWPVIFSSRESDAIIPLASATRGYNSAATKFVGVVHGPGTLVLGFAGPDLLDPASGVPAFVVSLLDRNIQDPIFIDLPGGR